MNQNRKVGQISKDIPKEIKYVIKGLGDDARLAIIVSLMKNEKMTFTELKNLLDLSSSSLTADLSVLQDGGLVTNILERKNKSYSYYMITDLAKLVLKSLFDLVIKLPKNDVVTPDKTSFTSSFTTISPDSLEDAITRFGTAGGMEGSQGIKEQNEQLETANNPTAEILASFLVKMEKKLDQLLHEINVVGIRNEPKAFGGKTRNVTLARS